MGWLGQVKTALALRRAAAAIEREAGMGFDARKNLLKGAKSYGFTLLGVALSAVVAYASDPVATQAALERAGISPGLVLALAPAITAVMRMVDNWLKHKGE